MSKPRIVYFDHDRPAPEQPVFPVGDAGPVILQLDGGFTTPDEVSISPNSRCALVHHGVADELNALPDCKGHVGSGRDALLLPSSAEFAARIFYDADRKTYGASYDFLAFAQDVPERVDYRIAIDNREYQATLSRLQFLSTTASRNGHGLRIRF